MERISRRAKCARALNLAIERQNCVQFYEFDCLLFFACFLGQDPSSDPSEA